MALSVYLLALIRAAGRGGACAGQCFGSILRLFTALQQPTVLPPDV